MYIIKMLVFFIIRSFTLIKESVKRHKRPGKKAASPERTAAERLAPSSIPKYVNQLVIPNTYKPFKHRFSRLYFVDISEFRQQILPKGFPKTTVWGYGGLVADPVTGRTKYQRSSPGATFEAVRGVPVKVKWFNRLKHPNLFPVDPTLHWANPNNMPMDPPTPWPSYPPGFAHAQKPVPTVTHLHGGEVPSVYDGHPEAWFACGGKKGPEYSTSLYTYPNTQSATTLWYHDHALGITRLNVQAGLAGFYLLRDRSEYRHDHISGRALDLPKGKYEIPLVIQDRSFNADGSFAFNTVGDNPELHPYWTPEFFGDAIMVNGKVWPNLNVERRQYRFRMLNGSNARFYNMKMSNGMKFIQIGSDGGFLTKPAALDTLMLAPAERADILIDFSSAAPGSSVTLQNDASFPFPGGNPPDPDATGQIMRFTVPADSCAPVRPPKLPLILNNIPRLKPDSPGRILTLIEIMGPAGPESVLLDGQKWSSAVSELPKVGSTEEWEIVNLTGDTHPIHLHLIQFQIFNRQNIRADEYKAKWEEINGMPPFDHPTQALQTGPFIDGLPIAPDENEKGWKDTVRMNPGQVTRIRVRFAPQDVPPPCAKPGKNLFPFDPWLGPGYVWHCHILDHEDNEMMRPYKIKK